jgi:hypothetical protein
MSRTVFEIGSTGVKRGSAEILNLAEESKNATHSLTRVIVNEIGNPTKVYRKKLRNSGHLYGEIRLDQEGSSLVTICMNCKQGMDFMLDYPGTCSHHNMCATVKNVARIIWLWAK